MVTCTVPGCSLARKETLRIIHFTYKRHRSSSSIAGVVLDGTLSERKLDIKASIPEVDDQFAIAEARCEDLQEKIDLVKIFKKRRKLKKRSTTRIMDQQKMNMPDENVPFISVRTQPKKKFPQQAARGYKDPDVIEQHRMISKNAETTQYPRLPETSGRPCGDGTCGQGVQITMRNPLDSRFSTDETDDCCDNGRPKQQLNAKAESRNYLGKIGKQKRVSKKIPKEEEETHDKLPVRRQGSDTYLKIIRRGKKRPQNPERPVVELFNKDHGNSSAGSSQEIVQMAQHEKADEAQLCDGTAGPEGDSTSRTPRGKITRLVRRLRSRRGYEMPTIASRMKQTDVHHYIATTNATRLPFVVTKSTAPSHNIVVNIQQVLNGLKTQQPLLGIPRTIAHHMGFRPKGKKSSLEASMSGSQDLSTIRLGTQSLKLPTHKCSYKRMLQLFREGDGMVPRFLSGVHRPYHSYSDYKQLDPERYEEENAVNREYRPSSNRRNASDVLL